MPDPAPAPNPNPAPAGGGNPAPAGGDPNPNPQPHYSTGWIKPDGTLDATAYAKFPEQYRGLGEGEFKNAKTFDDVLTKMHHLQGLAGRKGLEPLPAGATAEQIEERNALFRKVNGLGADAKTSYKLERPQDIPEQFWRQPAVEEAMSIAYKYGIPASAMTELLSSQMKSLKTDLAAVGQQEQQWVAKQETDFAANAQKASMSVDQYTDLAKRGAMKFGIAVDSPEWKSGFVRHLLAQAAIMTGEKAIVTGASDRGETATDIEKAKDIISNKKNEENAIYWDPNHPKNREVVDKVKRLQGIPV